MTRADAGVVAPVLPGIADPHDAAVGRAQPARALDLQEEEFDRIGRPGDLEPASGERAVLDLGAVVIGHELAARVVAAERRRGRCARLGGMSSGQARTRSGGMRIDRHVEARLAACALPAISGS